VIGVVKSTSLVIMLDLVSDALELALVTFVTTRLKKPVIALAASRIPLKIELIRAQMLLIHTLLKF